MENNDLKKIFQIQKVLQEAGYTDISRISNEIYDFCQETSTPLDTVLTRISKQEPWEYIRGYTEFCGNRIFVTKDTLIPRIETEQLVSMALDLINKEKFSTVIDVGTGSGCIIISIAKQLKEYSPNLIALDISKEALEVAKNNAKKNNVEKLIDFRNSNLLENIEVKDKENVLMVANLPYIPQNIYDNLDKSVKDYEPKTALLAGENGMLYYNQLFKQAKEMFSKATLLIEIDPSIKKEGHLKDALIFQDIYGLDRFALIRLL
ncbi:peptide chain release factor N(5)-glutamine methyltransferase [bacterium]|nr:peptide chain release factor N(5)-glutamine methyltransferase [bacterium]